jgi:hypothetical protein
VEIFMKHMNWLAVAAIAVFAAHANAGEQDVAPAASDNATVMSQAGSLAAQPVAPMKSNMVPAGKTRAEVQQELIQAQKDGSLARLNALYSGS